jgi:hypothetical protein
VAALFILVCGCDSAVCLFVLSSPHLLVNMLLTAAAMCGNLSLILSLVSCWVSLLLELGPGRLGDVYLLVATLFSHSLSDILSLDKELVLLSNSMALTLISVV